MLDVIAGSFELTPFMLPALGAAILAGGLVAIAWSHRRVPGGAAFALLMAIIGEWSLTYAFELAGANLSTKLLFDELEYVGIVLTPVAAVGTALTFAGRGRIVTPFRAAGLLIVPLVTLVLLWSNPTAGLVQTQASIDRTGPFSALIISHGPWFYVHIAYSYALMAIATVIVLTTLLHAPRVYHAQIVAMVFGILAPLVSNFVFLARIAPLPHLDLTPFAFTLTGVAMYVALFRLRFLDLFLGLPVVARNALLSRLPDAVFILDPEGRILDANPSARRLLGTTDAGVIGRPIDRVLLNLQDWPAIRAAMATVQREHGLASAEGSATYDLLMAPQFVASSYLAGWTVVLRDVTAYKDIERDLSEANRQLATALAVLRETQQQVVQQERLRALGELASGITHDFNNNLAIIAGFLELLTLERFDERTDFAAVRGYLAAMTTAVEDATVVVRRLREFYRPRAEGEPVGTIDLNELVEQVQELTHPRWKTQSQVNGISIDFLTELGKVPPVIGSATQLREVLTNLIFNALDALPSGGSITVASKTRDERVVLTVTDDGTGMSEEVRRRCLDPFFTTKGRDGSGMGLAVAYGIVKRHGGTIDVASEPGHGTTVTVDLPAVTDAIPTVPVTTTGVASSRRLKILLVEDVASLRHVYSIYLTDAGHAVETARNGREGLQLFLQGWYDVVITDLAMDELSGDQLARAIRRRAPRKPIILLTGWGELLKTSGEARPEFSLVLSKPVSAATLRQAVLSVANAEPAPIDRDGAEVAVTRSSAETGPSD
jgi:PAS domain S-box-containing protein